MTSAELSTAVVTAAVAAAPRRHHHDGESGGTLHSTRHKLARRECTTAAAHSLQQSQWELLHAAAALPGQLQWDVLVEKLILNLRCQRGTERCVMMMR